MPDSYSEINFEDLRRIRRELDESIEHARIRDANIPRQSMAETYSVEANNEEWFVYNNEIPSFELKVARKDRKITEIPRLKVKESEIAKFCKENFKN
jgi:hypothetical protein